jgi:hypothetical protein
MNLIIFLIVSIVLLGTDLIYHQIVSGQSLTENITKICQELEALKNGSAYDIEGLRAPDMEIPDFEIDLSNCEGYLK